MPSCAKCNSELKEEAAACPFCKADLSAGSIWHSDAKPIEPFVQTVPAWQWLLYAAVAIACVAYGLYGLFTGEMYLPGKRHTYTLQGSSAVLQSAAVLCFAVHLTLALLGYPGRKEGTQVHALLSRYSKYVALLLFMLSIFVR
jgi:predicted nucleotidyltransferase